MKKTILSVLILNSFFSCQYVYADDNTTNDTMTIWGSHLGIENNGLTHDQIEKFGKTNVATALGTLSGINIQKSGKRGELTVRVRGFKSKQIPLFFDGIPIYVPYDGNLDLSRFLTSDLSNIEVSKGYTSLIQGPNLMGGAINLTTQKPKDGLSSNIGVEQGFADNKRNAYNLNASLNLRNDLGYISIYGNKFDQDFKSFPKNFKQGIQENSASTDERGIIRLGLTPNITDEYTLTYINQDGSKNSPPKVSGSIPKMNYWQWPEYNKESLYLTTSTDLGQNLIVQSRIYHDTFKNTLLMYKENPNLNQQIKKKFRYSRYDDHSNGADLKLVYDINEKQKITFATHFKKDIHKSKDDPNESYKKYEDDTYSNGVEYSNSFDDLTIVSSISYDYRNSHKPDVITNMMSNEIKDHSFNYGIVSNYNINSKSMVSLSFSDRSRFPTLKERYSKQQFKHGRKELIPNPYLKPERAQIIDLSYSNNINHMLNIQSSIYMNSISNAIITKDINAKLSQNQNTDKVDYMGLDLSLSGDTPLTDLSYGLNYSYIKANPKENIKITGLPKNTVYGWINYKPKNNLSLVIAEEARSSTFGSSNGKVTAAGFAITNLIGKYNITKSIELTAKINNIFDTEYYYTEGYPEEGLNYWVGFNYSM